MILALVVGVVFAAQLPTVYITTADSSAITSRDDWKDATRLRIVMPTGEVAYASDEAAVKGRGHSTFTKPKKPYAIKLKDEAPILGMTPAKRWVLLANFMDHSLLRNSLALAVAKQTSLEWTPDSRLVDVVVNGRPQGCYLLTEQISVGKHWVDTDKDTGFLVELDTYPDDKYRFETATRHLPVNVTYPKKPTKAQQQAIEEDINRVERLVYGRADTTAADYLPLIDEDSFADWWIVNELCQNAEPNGPRSCYIYKGRDGRLKAGPVWDYDLAFITVGLDAGGDIRPARFHRTDVVTLTGDSIYNRHALWYDRLLQDPRFARRVAERWAALEPKFKTLADSLDHWARMIEPSALADEEMWRGQDPARFDNFTEWRASVANLRKVYVYRIESLRRLLSDPKTFGRSRK